MKSDTLGVFIRTAVFGFIEQDTTVDNKDFKRIEIPEEPIDRDTLNAGKPQIPYVRLLIAVPDSCNFDITVYESNYTLFEDYLIYPVPRIVFEETSGCFCSKEVYTYDATFYQKDTLYPGKFYEIISDGHWRDQRVLEVFLYPVQFNPAQELMYFYSGLDLRIKYSGEVVENENGLGPFEDIGREILLNYPGIDKEPESVPEPLVHYYTDLIDTNNVADYIIVTHQDFLADSTDSFWIHEFAQWRVNHNQFDVGIVRIQDIYEQFDSLAPDSAAQLKHFLQYAYDYWDANSMTDGHFAYCLFIGDWDYIPTFLFIYEADLEWLGANELYFADFVESGSEFLADIMLGRWPVKGTEQPTAVSDLITIAQKTISYESEPDTGDWRRRGLLIAGGGLGASDFNNLVTFSTPYFSDINYDTLTVRWLDINNAVAFRESIDNNLNHGEIITVYYDHGAPQGWWKHYDTLWVKELANGTRLPVVLSVACLTALFQWDHPFYDSHDCRAGISLGEHFLINPDGGAVAFWGAAAHARHSSLNLGLESLRRIFCYQHWILGKSLFLTGRYSGNYCLLGDPALDLGDYTAYPDLPDLVVRPQGIDISLLPPYPYSSTNDIIPIRAKIWNIGGAVAHNVDIKFEVVYPDAPGQPYTDIITIDEIEPLDTVVVTGYWHTDITHPDFYGEIGNCEFIVTADPDSEITESWEYNNASSTTKQVVLYPGWSKKIPLPLGIDESMPAIANLDGTGAVEIVCPGLDSLYVFDPEGNLVSPWPKYFKDVYSVVLGDINNNGTIDIVAVSPESIKVYDYQGNILPGWPVQIEDENYQFNGLPALGRIESGVSDVLNVIVAAKITSEAPAPVMPMKIFVYNRQGSLVYTFNTHVGVSSACRLCGLSIENIRSDGNDEIVISFGKETVQPIITTRIFNYNGIVDSLDYGADMISALVDLDNDGYAEIITGGSDKKIRAYKAMTGQILWEQETEGAINSSPAVGDIYPGLVYPGVEITFGNDVSQIHLLEKDEGTPIPYWPYVIDPSTMVQTSPAIANINGDHDIDIMIGTDNNYIYAFKYTRDTIAPYPLPLFGKPSSPIIGDIDGDTKNEVILSSRDGYLHVWENKDTKVPPYSLEWPQFHHDYQRTGLYGWVGGLRGGDASPKQFSTGTTLSFTLEDNLHTKIKIFDAEGHPVKTLVNQTLPQGTYHPVWYGKNDNYAFLPNGIYFIEIKIRNESKIIPVEINR